MKPYETRAALLYDVRRPIMHRTGLRRRIVLILIGVTAIALTGLLANTVAAGEHDMHHDHAMHQNHDMHMDHSAHMEAMPKGVTRSVVDYALPDLALVGTDGRARKLSEELAVDRPVLVNFIFTTCTTVCPVSSGTFAKVQASLDSNGQKYRLISISIDPEHDTPARLRDYAAKYRAGDDWHFLTGDKTNIVEVQRAFDAYRGNKMNHTPVTLMRASVGAPWVRYDGFVDPNMLVGEYQKLVTPGKLARN